VDPWADARQPRRYDRREYEERERSGGLPQRGHDHAQQERYQADENREKISVGR
jgi:hypothetical protein